jgi:hypothetical protein
MGRRPAAPGAAGLLLPLAAGVVLGSLAGLLSGALASPVGGLFAGIGAEAALTARVIRNTWPGSVQTCRRPDTAASRHRGRGRPGR